MDVKKTALFVGSGSLFVVALACIWFVINAYATNREAEKMVKEFDAEMLEDERQMDAETERIKVQLEESGRKMQKAFDSLPRPSRSPSPAPRVDARPKWDPRHGLPPGVQRSAPSQPRRLGEGGD